MSELEFFRLDEPLGDRFHESCAALGIWGVPDAAQYAARGLLANLAGEDDTNSFPPHLH